MTDLRAQLQSAVGNFYTLELASSGELSRVFLVTEHAMSGFNSRLAA